MEEDELMPFVIDRKIQIRVRIFGAEHLLHFGQSEIAIALIDIHLLQTNNVRILRDEVLQYLVLIRFLEIAHTAGVPSEDGDIGY